jgi:hypothetical protein
MGDKKEEQKYRPTCNVIFCRVRVMVILLRLPEIPEAISLAESAFKRTDFYEGLQR